jgi:hypothetical protein
METKIYEVESLSGNVVVLEAATKYDVLDMARHIFGVNDPVARIEESHPEVLHCYTEHIYEGK